MTANTAPSDVANVEKNGGPPTSLRDWIDRLAAKGRVAITRPGISLEYTLAAIGKHLDGRKAVLFPRPGGHSMPVVTGVVATRTWIAESMCVGEDAVLARFSEAADRPRPCREVTDAPVHAVVHRDGDVAEHLPIPTHHELDNGPYITAGLVIARNPKTGAQNVSIHRCQVSGPRRLGVLILPRHLNAYFAMAEAAKSDLAVAVVIGVDPLTLLASQAIAPLDCDELEIASALHKAPLEVVKCLTNDVRVPARAEIVIEGRLLPGVRETEGPFGEFPKYYGSRSEKPVIEIDAITHRDDALFHTIVPAAMEHLLLGGIPREATLLAELQRNYPNVRDVHLTTGGVCRYHLNVKIAKRQKGEAKNVILAALAGHYDIKRVVTVDEDVDVHDRECVEWAVATRFQADRDLVVVANAQGSKLDPSSDQGVGAKMGLDATVPLDADQFSFTPIRIPGESDIDVTAEIFDEEARDWRARLRTAES